MSIDHTLNLLEQADEYENAIVRISNFKWDVGNVTLEVLFKNGVDPDWFAVSEIRCENVYDFRLKEEWAGAILVEEDHVLASQFTAPQSQVYFSGKCREPQVAAYALHQAHVAATNGWIDFRSYLNTSLPLDELLAGGHGQLGSGPRWLMAAYEASLAPYGIRFSGPPATSHKRWNGDDSSFEAPPDLSVLIVGDSYIVASKFSDSER